MNFRSSLTAVPARLAVVVLLLLTAAGAAFARPKDKVENRPYADMKRWHLGFSVGMSLQDFKFTHNGFVTSDGQQWYCDVPGFPKELFEHTLMVGGASKFLEYYSRGEIRIKATIKIANEMDDKYFCGSRLYKNSSTLTGGAFYKDPSGNFDEEIWLCPVTLFLLGKYPERILIYRINKNVLSCPIYFE